MHICIGLDVHAKKITSYSVPLEQNDEESIEFCKEFNKEFKCISGEKPDMLRMARWLSEIEHCILIENSTKTHEVFWTLTDAGCTVVVANAADLYRITNSVKKTDSHDCEELAGYMRRRVMGEKEFSSCLMVNSTWLNRRQLCRQYHRYSEDLSDTKRRIRAFMLVRGIVVKRMDSDIVAQYNLKELAMIADSSMHCLLEDAK